MNNLSGFNETDDESVWRVCDELIAKGQQPTLRFVRAMGIKRESDQEIQNAIKSWFSNILKTYTLHNSLAAPMPPDFVSAGLAIWDLAKVNATKIHDLERKRFEEIISELGNRLKLALDETAVLKAENDRQRSDLNAAFAKISELSALLEDYQKFNENK